MIEKLDGIKETVNYLTNTHIRLYDNDEAEYLGSSDTFVHPSQKREKNPVVSENNLTELMIYSKVLKMITLIGRHHIQSVEQKSPNIDKQQEYIEIMCLSIYSRAAFHEIAKALQKISSARLTVYTTFFLVVWSVEIHDDTRNGSIIILITFIHILNHIFKYHLFSGSSMNIISLK